MFPKYQLRKVASVSNKLPMWAAIILDLPQSSVTVLSIKWCSWCLDFAVTQTALRPQWGSTRVKEITRLSTPCSQQCAQVTTCSSWVRKSCKPMALMFKCRLNALGLHLAPTHMMPRICDVSCLWIMDNWLTGLYYAQVCSRTKVATLGSKFARKETTVNQLIL